jgi:hypothetical protein
MKLRSALTLFVCLFALAALACSFGASTSVPAPTPKPAQTQSCKWTGTWNTEWGGVTNGTALLVLRQKGKNVTGEYTYAWVDSEVNGQLEGTVDETLLTGTWEEGDSVGTLTFDLEKDCNAFTGEWNRDTGEGGDWDGTRVKFTPPEPTSQVVDTASPEKAIQTAVSAHQGIYVNADGYSVLEAKPLSIPNTTANAGIVEAWCVSIYYTWTSSDEAGFVYTEESTRAYIVVHRDTATKAWTARSTDMYGCEEYDELR